MNRQVVMFYINFTLFYLVPVVVSVVLYLMILKLIQLREQTLKVLINTQVVCSSTFDGRKIPIEPSTLVKKLSDDDQPISSTNCIRVNSLDKPFDCKNANGKLSIDHCKKYKINGNSNNNNENNNNSNNNNNNKNNNNENNNNNANNSSKNDNIKRSRSVQKQKERTMNDSNAIIVNEFNSTRLETNQKHFNSRNKRVENANNNRSKRCQSRNRAIVDDRVRKLMNLRKVSFGCGN